MQAVGISHTFSISENLPPHHILRQAYVFPNGAQSCLLELSTAGTLVAVVNLRAPRRLSWFTSKLGIRGRYIDEITYLTHKVKLEVSHHGPTITVEINPHLSLMAMPQALTDLNCTVSFHLQVPAIGVSIIDHFPQELVYVSIQDIKANMLAGQLLW